MRRAVIAIVLLPRLASAASIQGIVVEHFSGRPLARAEVKLAALGSPGTAGGEIKTRANTVGQFLFSGLGVGAYLLTASRTGFAELRYGQKTWKAWALPLSWPSRSAIMWRSCACVVSAPLPAWCGTRTRLGCPSRM